MKTSDTTRLATLVELKLSLLERLVELGQSQVEFIDAGDYTQLLKLLGVKQRVLGGLNDVESALSPFKDQVPESRPWPSAAERLRCQEHLRRCEELLRMILAQEQSSEQQMIHQRDDNARQIEALQFTARANSAYHAEAWQSSVPLSQLDLASEG
jgi:hypothetical protein